MFVYKSRGGRYYYSKSQSTSTVAPAGVALSLLACIYNLHCHHQARIINRASKCALYVVLLRNTPC